MFDKFGSHYMLRFFSGKLLILITLFALISVPQATAESPESAYVWPKVTFNPDPYSVEPGYRIAFKDSFAEGNSSAEGRSFISVTGSIQPICNGFDDPECQTLVNSNRGNWWSNAVLDPCAITTYQEGCIEQVTINSGSTSRKLELIKVLPSNKWPAKEGFMPAGSASLWRDPQNPLSDQGFLVTVSGGLGLEGNPKAPSGTNLSGFSASILPYKLIKGDFKPPQLTRSGSYQRYNYFAPDFCLWVDNGECGYRISFDEGSRLGIKVKIPSRLTGFLLGRLSSPQISVNKINYQTSLLSVEGEIVQVPLFDLYVSAKDAEDELKNWYAKNHSCGNDPVCRSGRISSTTVSSYQYAFDAFNLFKNHVPKNAAILMPYWSVRSLGQGLGGCSTDGQFLGLVTTNAAIYEGKPPTFKDGFLEYKVAGVHNNPDGTVFQGKYDLVLNSKTARCLYKFSNAPISASVSIINNEGSTNIQTTTFTEKDGWTYLSANGFTFSSPTIKVKLTQDVGVKVETNSKPSVAQKTKAITCVKGKSVKKVSGTSPKCPSGYKAK